MCAVCFPISQPTISRRLGERGRRRRVPPGWGAQAPGTKYWLWKHPKLKGAAQLTTPTGEVKCQGNLMQQAARGGGLGECPPPPGGVSPQLWLAPSSCSPTQIYIWGPLAPLSPMYWNLFVGFVTWFSHGPQCGDACEPLVIASSAFVVCPRQAARCYSP